MAAAPHAQAQQNQCAGGSLTISSRNGFGKVDYFGEILCNNGWVPSATVKLVDANNQVVARQQPLRLKQDANNPSRWTFDIEFNVNNAGQYTATVVVTFTNQGPPVQTSTATGSVQGNAQ